MTLNEYQLAANATAIYPGRGSIGGLNYTILGLGESGEVQGTLKKMFRDNHGILDTRFKNKLISELGDVLWYLSQAAKELGMSLDDIAQANLDKLDDRAKRGVLQGSGDDR